MVARNAGVEIYDCETEQEALARIFPEYSRNRLKDWLLTGAITVQGGPKRPRDRVFGGEIVKR